MKKILLLVCLTTFAAPAFSQEELIWKPLNI